VPSASSSTLVAIGHEWQSGEVASEEIIRTLAGKKLIYRYSNAVHGNGYTYTFDKPKKLH